MRLNRTLTALALTAVVAHPEAQFRWEPQNPLALLELTGEGTAGKAALSPPAGARALNGSSGSAFSRSEVGSSSESGLWLESSLTVGEIASHYTKQIIGRSWSLEGSTTDRDDLAVGRFGGKTAANEAVSALLTVARLSTTRVDVALRILQFTPSPTVTPTPTPTRRGGAGANAAAGAVTPPGRSGSGRSATTGAIGGAKELDAEVRQLLLADVMNFSPGQLVIQRELPADFPADLLPARAAIEAAAVSPAAATVVARATDLEPAFLTAHLRSLESNGWVIRMMSAGFESPLGVMATVCRGVVEAELGFVPRRMGGVLVRAAVTRAEQCRARLSQSIRFAAPLLLHPDGVDAVAMSSAGGIDRAHWNARVMPVSNVLRLAQHYAGQMTRSNWTLAGRVDGPTLSVTRYSTDSAVAILALLQVPGTDGADAWLRVVLIK
jgi:hypothetical protein